MDRAIIGIVLTVSAVSLYEVTFRIQSLATLAMVMASSAVLPAAAYNASRLDVEKQRELFLRGTKYAVALVLPITVAAMLYARILIIAWVGAKYASVAGETRLFLVFPLVGCLNQVGVAMLIGLGLVRRVLALQVVAVATNLVLSLVLARHFGIAGVILGTLVGNLAVWLPYVRLLLAAFDVSPGAWLRRIVLPNVPGAAAQLAVGVATYPWTSRVTALGPVGCIAVASCAVYAVTFAVTGLSTDERRHLVTRVIGG